MRRTLVILISFILLIAGVQDMSAQFRTNKMETGSNTVNMAAPPGASTQTAAADTSGVSTDSTAGFSFKKLFRGYAGKDTLTPGYMLLGAALVPGAGQIHNKDYWKLPLVYGGIGAGIYSGIHFNNQYKISGDSKDKLYSTLGFAGAGLFYWGSLMDCTISYKTPIRKPVPAKATIYSILLPGLGQAYNGDYWKIPIWVGGFVACGYFYHLNDIQYKRFRYICIMDTDKSSGYIGAITNSQAEWYRDLYRKYRDYSILGFVLVYALNIIDANVFSYMHDFDVSDNLASVQIQPAVIEPIYPNLASNGNPVSSVGLQMHINF